MSDVPVEAARPAVAEALTPPTPAPVVPVFSMAFLRYAGERALKTLAQVLIALMTAAQVGALHVGAMSVLVTVGFAVLASLCTSVVAATSSVDPGSTS